MLAYRRPWDIRNAKYVHEQKHVCAKERYEHWLSGEDEPRNLAVATEKNLPLLVRLDALLLFHTLLNPTNGVCGLDIDFELG